MADDKTASSARHASVAKSVVAAQSMIVVIRRSCVAVTGRMQVRVLSLAQQWHPVLADATKLYRELATADGSAAAAPATTAGIPNPTATPALATAAASTPHKRISFHGGYFIILVFNNI